MNNIEMCKELNKEIKKEIERIDDSRDGIKRERHIKTALNLCDSLKSLLKSMQF